MKFPLKVSLVLLLFFFFLEKTNAEELPCANQQFQELLFNDPQYKSAFEAVNNAMTKINSTERITENILEVPIVVNVLHLGEPVGTGVNISDQQIIEAVQGANERWRKANTILGVDMEVQFCLAQKDINGNPTNGIVRKDASVVPLYKDYGISYIGALGQPGSDEQNTKNLSNWPHNYVYNVWVVNKIAGGWGGYAMFPFTFDYPTDGVVIVANSMRYSSATLAHELGHGMGLFHTFQGDDNGCPANDICSLFGDWVCDTPPHRQNDCGSSSCNNGTDANNSYKNIMSYCADRVLFTQGQKTRARGIMTSTTRKVLLNSTACVSQVCENTSATVNNTTCDSKEAGIKTDTLANASGCDSIVTTNTALLPSASAAFTFIQNGYTVSFQNHSQNALNYKWNFGDGSTSIETNPEHTYSDDGEYTVALEAENSCGTDSSSALITMFLTSIKNYRNTSEILIYPNPNKGSFTLKTNIAIPENSFLKITNLLGQQVYFQKLDVGNTHQINLDKNKTQGIYQLQIITNGAIISSNKICIY